MKIFRFAAILAAISCLMATTDAVAQAHGGHMGGMHAGGMHAGGAHAHGFRHDGFRHDGRFFGGGRFASSFVVVGGLWYPWYTTAVPVYANPGYYYYCQSAGAYYPAVTACPEPWLLVAP